MSSQQNLDTARQVIDEAFNKGNYAVLQNCFDPGYAEHQFGLHTTLDGFQHDIEFLRKAFPDFHLAIEDMAADADKVWLRMTARGTNLGGMMGPANGKTFEIAVFDLLRFANGKIVEHWGSPDRFAQMVQLGLIPK
jgi:predicted ester cyclase